MRQLNGKFILSLVIALMCCVLILTYMLHHCSESLTIQKVETRKELKKELKEDSVQEQCCVIKEIKSLR